MIGSQARELWAVVAHTTRGRELINTGAWQQLALPAELRLHVVGPGIALAGTSILEQPSAAGTTWVYAPRNSDHAPLASACAGLADDPETVLRSLRLPFALACWDNHRQRLVLARDHFGQQQLFLRRMADVTVACSALEPLLRLSTCALDTDSAAHYLMFGRPAPGRTLAQDVCTLPAGHFRIFRSGLAPSTTRYFTPLSPDATRDNTPEFRAQFAQRLNERIELDARCPERVGVLLSGGLDSSYLAACLNAQRSERNNPNTPVAYTVEFDSSFGVNETEYAQQMAAHVGWEHRVVHVAAEQALTHLETALRLPEPCAAAAILSNLALMEAALSDGTRRMLSGLGSDELLGSYSRMLLHYGAFVDLLRESAPPSPSWLFRHSQLLEENSGVVLYPGVCQFITADLRKKAFGKDYAKLNWCHPLQTFYTECLELKPDAHIFELMVAHECQHRIPEVLLPGLAGSARSRGVELRFPFLDPHVATLATGLKASARLIAHADGTATTKLPLRELAQPLLPQAIMNRPRAAFLAPFRNFMHDRRFAAPVTTRLRQSKLYAEGLVSKSWMNELVEELYQTDEGPLNAENNLWTLLTLCGWYDEYAS